MNIILNTIFFVVGFSVVFSTMGVVINSVLSSSASSIISGLNQMGGDNHNWIWRISFTFNKNSKAQCRKEIFPKKN